MSAAGTGLQQTSGNVNIAHPATAPTGGWATLELTACVKGTQQCVVQQPCNASTTANTTVCPVSGLTPNSTYTITVRCADRCAC